MSSPQTVATQVVFNYEYDTAGRALSGLNVHCVLNYSQATISSPAVSIEASQQSTTTDANGYWQFSLVPNVNISPANTTYTIIVQGGPTYDITVGAAGPYQATAVGTIVNTPQALLPATSGLTGPITVTGNETVTGNLTVNGTSTLAGTTTGALTTGAASIGGDLTIQSAFRLLIATAASKLVPGATSFSVRDNADANDNLLVTNAGAATVRNGLTVTAGDAVITAGRLLLSSAAAKIKGGATSLSLRNNADSADNVLITDAGNVTIRGTLTYVNLFKARAFLGAAQNLAGGGVYTLINLDTKTYDTNTNFNTVSHQYTVPLTGYYNFGGAFEAALNNTAQQFTVAIFKNGAVLSRGNEVSIRGGTGGDFYGCTVSDTQSLTAGDTLDLRGFNGGGANTCALSTGTTVTYMYVYFLGT